MGKQEQQKRWQENTLPSSSSCDEERITSKNANGNVNIWSPCGGYLMNKNGLASPIEECKQENKEKGKLMAGPLTQRGVVSSDRTSCIEGLKMGSKKTSRLFGPQSAQVPYNPQQPTLRSKV
ncbi:hypothetical protein VTJ04DRAFT_1158 [Mycothermus thermophilus]|uniref:uncharacterized protein n=1 Tax=Humicola insolens TaxID=85995 RepID=UPI003743F631